MGILHTGIGENMGGASLKQSFFPNFTKGSIYFVGSNRTPAQDNTNFFWDNTHKWLGIRTVVPGATIDIDAATCNGIHINGGVGNCIRYANAGGAPGVFPLVAPFNMVGVALPNYYLCEPQAWARFEIGGGSYNFPLYQ